MEKWTLLSFHPLAWTAFCAGQMQSLEDNREVLSAFGTRAVGISVDSVPCKKAWAESLGLPILPCCVISGHMEFWLSSTGFSVRQMVFQNEHTSSLTKTEHCVCKGLSGPFRSGYWRSDHIHQKQKKPVKVPKIPKVNRGNSFIYDQTMVV